MQKLIYEKNLTLFLWHKCLFLVFLQLTFGFRTARLFLRATYRKQQFLRNLKVNPVGTLHYHVPGEVSRIFLSSVLSASCLVPMNSRISEFYFCHRRRCLWLHQELSDNRRKGCNGTDTQSQQDKIITCCVHDYKSKQNLEQILRTVKNIIKILAWPAGFCCFSSHMDSSWLISNKLCKSSYCVSSSQFMRDSTCYKATTFSSYIYWTQLLSTKWKS